MEYIFGGCELNLHIAIDFTASNGDPNSRDSYHTKDVNRNQYLHAINAVGGILQYYDSDKMIPTYGFGANIGGAHGTAYHKFALNGDCFRPECNGIDGVIEAYWNAIQKTQLYGPTNFSEIISDVCDRIEV